MIIFLIAVIQLAHQSKAVPPCLPRSDLLGDLAAVNAPLKVNQVDEADRRTAKDYAAEHNTTEEEIKRRYAATGDLNCGGGKSQANVVLVGDVIATSAHSLGGGPKKCVDPNKPVKCTFITEVDGVKAEYETTALIDSGWTCGYPDVFHPGSDWAVLKLNKKVDPRIKPYGIDPKIRLRTPLDTKIVSVGKSSDFPDAKAQDLFQHPRHYGDCQTKQPVGSGILTNCDVSPGASGGAVLTPGPDPILIATNASNIYGGTDCPKPNFAKKKGAYSMCWASKSEFVTTDYAAALQKAAAESAAGR